MFSWMNFKMLLKSELKLQEWVSEYIDQLGEIK